MLLVACAFCLTGTMFLERGVAVFGSWLNSLFWGCGVHTHRCLQSIWRGKKQGDRSSVLGSRAVQQWVEVFCVYSFTVIVLIRLKFTLQTQSASNTLQKHKSSSSFTPFIDPRLLQISPSSGTTVTSVGK